MKFKVEFLKDTLELPHSALEDRIIDQSRWSTFHEIIFEHEGKFYLAEYSEGSTESQFESPWDDLEEVECIEVEQVPVLELQWLPKNR